MVLVVLLVLFYAVAFPRHGDSQSRARMSKRIRCLQQLKEVGLALRNFASEHTDLPMNLPAIQGGTREWSDDPGSGWRHVLVLSNALATPAMLWCPADVERKPATTFGAAS